MELPIIIKQLYGEFSFTGLYSFEFVDKKRNTLAEIFFMLPPKQKDTTESTRASVNPTLAGNYILDAGNGIKTVNLSGRLYFPYVGSPSNPIAFDNSKQKDITDGLTELLTLRWMLIRYRDYTMTKKGSFTIPVASMSRRPEIANLYKKLTKNLKKERGALYDQVRLIFHDYDLDDHFFCRVVEFKSSQTDAAVYAAEYNISLECYEKDNKQTTSNIEIKETLASACDVANKQLQNIDYDEKIQACLQSITAQNKWYTQFFVVREKLTELDAANSDVQTGAATPIQTIPSLLQIIISMLEKSKSLFLKNMLTEAEYQNYLNNDFSLSETLSYQLIDLYNSFCKGELIARGLLGLLNSEPVHNTIIYGSTADDYTLTQEQYTNEDNTVKTSSTSEYKYYTIQEGDTARIIALREYGNAEKFVPILMVNNISEAELQTGELVGYTIKIPIEGEQAGRLIDNLVYEPDDANYAKYVYGTDIKLDVNKNFIISGSGDIAVHTGLPVVYASLMTRLSTSKGGLNVFAPNFGLISIGDGSSPLMVRVQNYITDFTTQIQADPRVSSLVVDVSSIQLQGERLYLKATVNFPDEKSLEVEING